MAAPAARRTPPLPQRQTVRAVPSGTHRPSQRYRVIRSEGEMGRWGQPPRPVAAAALAARQSAAAAPALGSRMRGPEPAAARKRHSCSRQRVVSPAQRHQRHSGRQVPRGTPPRAASTCLASPCPTLNPAAMHSATLGTSASAAASRSPMPACRRSARRPAIAVRSGESRRARTPRSALRQRFRRGPHRCGARACH